MRLDLSLTVPLQHKHSVQKNIRIRNLLKDCREKRRFAFPTDFASAGILCVEARTRLNTKRYYKKKETLKTLPCIWDYFPILKQQTHLRGASSFGSLWQPRQEFTFYVFEVTCTCSGIDYSFMLKKTNIRSWKNIFSRCCRPSMTRRILFPLNKHADLVR